MSNSCFEDGLLKRCLVNVLDELHWIISREEVYNYVIAWIQLLSAFLEGGRRNPRTETLIYNNFMGLTARQSRDKQTQLRVFQTQQVRPFKYFDTWHSSKWNFDCACQWKNVVNHCSCGAMSSGSNRFLPSWTIKFVWKTAVCIGFRGRSCSFGRNGGQIRVAQFETNSDELIRPPSLRT